MGTRVASRLGGCADVCVGEKACHLLPSQVISLTDPCGSEIKHSRSTNVLVKSHPLKVSIWTRPSFLILLNSNSVFNSGLVIFRLLLEFHPCVRKMSTHYGGCIAWWPRQKKVH